MSLDRSTFKVLELSPTTPILIGEEGETPPPQLCQKPQRHVSNRFLNVGLWGDSSGTPWYTYIQTDEYCQKQISQHKQPTTFDAKLIIELSVDGYSSAIPYKVSCSWRRNTFLLKYKSTRYGIIYSLQLFSGLNFRQN